MIEWRSEELKPPNTSIVHYSDVRRLASRKSFSGLRSEFCSLKYLVASHPLTLARSSYARLVMSTSDQFGSRALEDEKISHTAMNIAAITGPITKPLRPKIAMPPRVAISTT